MGSPAPRAETDVVVIGAGVVGLAVAAALARVGRSVLVIERHSGLGREVTARSSEVIHAGLYHGPETLKARLCVEGRERLYARCAERRIPHRRTGKLVVATREGERARLETLCARGTANGVTGLTLVGAAAVRRREPAVHAVGALWSPESGIVDAAALTLDYAAEAEAHGAVLALARRVVSIAHGPGGYAVETVDPHGAAGRVTGAALVNAAGLEADRVAALAGIDVDDAGYRLHPCKGDYFALAPTASIALSHLIYPVPAGDLPGLHATLDLRGAIRFGPDVEYVDAPHYAVDESKAGAFAAAVQAYLPDLRAEWLTPAYAGVRPRLAAPGEEPRDFVVCEESDRGRPGLVSLIGIESPGLTAAPAIAERVAALLAGL